MPNAAKILLYFQRDWVPLPGKDGRGGEEEEEEEQFLFHVRVGLRFRKDLCAKVRVERKEVGRGATTSDWIEARSGVCS
jgi:hypothetical protein